MNVLDRRRTIAPPGFNRWLVPPAALAVHLSIGQIYSFSVLKEALIERFDASHTQRVEGAALYTPSLVAMTAVLVVGFTANVLIRAVDAKHHEPATATIPATTLAAAPAAPQVPGAPVMAGATAKS